MVSQKEIDQLKQDGVTLKQIQTELDYRDVSNYGWYDDLYEYSTEELEQIENEWKD
jgi:hypothetical protein